MLMIATDPLKAADALDMLGDDLHKLAVELRRDKSGMRDSGGMIDTCKLVVVGPYGDVKQTGGNHVDP